VVSLLGALGIGSVVGNYVGAGRARREVRSAVFKELAAVEGARWIGSTDTDWRAFRTAMHSVETSALVARIPRRAVQHYVVFAQAARQLSEESYEERGGDEDMGAGGINGHFARDVSEAARILARLAWSPWLARLDLRWRLRKLRHRAAKHDDEVQHALRDAQYMFGELPAPRSAHAVP
jgi:hypothetical protein